MEPLQALGHDLLDPTTAYLLFVLGLYAVLVEVSHPGALVPGDDLHAGGPALARQGQATTKPDHTYTHGRSHPVTVFQTAVADSAGRTG